MVRYNPGSAVRILTVTSSYPKYPGDTTAPFISHITRELAARGHELTVVLPYRSDLDLPALDGVHFVPFRYAPTRRLAVFGYAEALRADVALRGATYVAAPLALASGAARLWREAGRGGFDVLHAHWVVPNGAMALPAVWRHALPLVVSLHGSDVFLSETKGAFRRAARRTFGRALGATACSDDLADRSLALGAEPRPRVIPYGVDLDGFEPSSVTATARRRALGIPDETPVILAVGRLVHKKGFEYLIDSLGSLDPSVAAPKLIVVGRGDLAGELEARARAAGVQDRVELAGNVERGELPSYYAMADICAVPSVIDASGNVDGLPNVLLESMASGSAIVASDVAGIPQAIRHDRDGLLVPPKDASALARAIERLISSPELRGALGASARARAESEFNWKLVGERFESVLGAVAKTRS